MLGERRRLPAEGAALVNRTYAHALDFEDTHLPSIVHPSAPLVPAVLAQAEAIHASPQEILVALTVGYQVSCRIAMGQYDPTLRNSVYSNMDSTQPRSSGPWRAQRHVAASWTSIATETAHAMSIACSFGSGLIEANRSGGSVKKLHAGWAAHGAIVSARLAAAGLTGPKSIFEGRFGFFQAFSRESGTRGPLPANSDRHGRSWRSTSNRTRAITSLTALLTRRLL